MTILSNKPTDVKSFLSGIGRTDNQFLINFDKGQIYTDLTTVPQDQNLYYQFARPAGFKKAKKQELTEVLGCHVDLDPTEGIDKAKLLRLVQQFAIAPSFVVDSGRGIQAAWLFTTPVTLDGSEGSWAQVEAINAALLKALAPWDTAGTWNVDRVLRAPFTVNVGGGKKGNLNAPVRILVWGGPTYTPAFLAEKLNATPIKKEALKEVEVSSEVASAEQAEAELEKVSAFTRTLISKGHPLWPALPNGQPHPNTWVEQFEEDHGSLDIEKAADRSHWTWKAIEYAHRDGMSTAAMIYFLTNESYLISAHVLDSSKNKGQPLKYAKRQVTRALERSHTQAPEKEKVSTILPHADIMINEKLTSGKGEEIIKGVPLQVFGHETLEAFANRPDVYVNNARWVRVYDDKIAPIPEKTLKMRIAEVTTFHQFKKTKDGKIYPTVMQSPHAEAVEYVSGMASDPHVSKSAKVLTSVRPSPVLAPNGDVVATGYHNESGFLISSDCPQYEEMSIGEAKATIAEYFGDFQCGEHREGVSVDVVTALLTAVARPTLYLSKAASPGIAILANAGGEGKSLLAECLYLTVGISHPHVTAFGNSEEGDKALLSSLNKDPNVLFFDNVETGSTFGSPMLDSWLTSTTHVGARELGRNHMAEHAWTALTILTANKIRFAGEGARRWMRVKIKNVPGFCFQRSEDSLKIEVFHNRGKIYSAAATLLREHIRSGRKANGCKAVNSYTKWTEIVAGCVLKHYGVDPTKYILDQAEPTNEELLDCMVILHEVCGEKGLTSRELSSEHPALCKALFAAREAKHENLGKVLSGMIDRPSAGIPYTLKSRTGKARKQFYYVERNCSDAQHEEYLASAPSYANQKEAF